MQGIGCQKGNWDVKLYRNSEIYFNNSVYLERYVLYVEY